MARDLKPQPLDPIREWIGPDGEEWVAMHPLYLALSRHYCPDAKGLSWLEIIHERLKEFCSGERRLPRSVAEEILEFDRGQQENGCPDENLAQLVELLRSPAGA
jgi:hypothetical protein